MIRITIPIQRPKKLDKELDLDLPKLKDPDPPPKKSGSNALVKVGLGESWRDRVNLELTIGWMGLIHVGWVC